MRKNEVTKDLKLLTWDFNRAGSKEYIDTVSSSVF